MLGRYINVTIAVDSDEALGMLPWDVKASA